MASEICVEEMTALLDNFLGIAREHGDAGVFEILTATRQHILRLTAENAEMRKELDTIRSEAGPECPDLKCRHGLNANHRLMGSESMRALVCAQCECWLYVSDLQRDHPDIARELGLEVKS